MIAIVTDSTCDLPENIVQEYQIRIIPLYIHIGESVFQPGVNLTNEQFLYRLQTSLSLPTTEPPTVEDFQKAYRSLWHKVSDIVSIHISSHLSETYNRAMAAREALLNAPDKPDNFKDIHVVDSKSVSVGLGIMILAAARQAIENKPVEAILKQLDSMSIHHRFYFVVNTLEYLHKGGRIGGARALLGTVLQMKPILTMQEGHLEPLEQVRTKPKAIARLRQLVTDGLAGRTHIHLAIAHSSAPDEAQRLYDDLVAVVEPTYTLLAEVGPIVATHAGPGTLGAAFYSE